MPNAIILKAWMAGTGLFLVLFLIVHALGNAQLFLPPELAQTRFNAYSQALTSNPLIQVASWITYASVVVHTILSIRVTRRNAAARSTRYHLERPQHGSRWYARSMGILGVVLLLFLVVHLWGFWYPYRFGDLARDAAGHVDLYAIVVGDFSNVGIVTFYVVCMVAVGFHVRHGVVAGVRSLGLYGRGATRTVERIAPWLAWGLVVLFAAMPLTVYLRGLR